MVIDQKSTAIQILTYCITPFFKKKYCNTVLKLLLYSVIIMVWKNLYKGFVLSITLVCLIENYQHLLFVPFNVYQTHILYVLIILRKNNVKGQSKTMFANSYSIKLFIGVPINDSIYFSTNHVHL